MGNKGLNIKINGIPEWKKWALALDGNLKKAAERATKKATQLAIKEIQERIRAGKYTKLSPLTRLLRTMDGYGTTPLLRRGD